ncbi:MAG: diguanylate cyclase [Myxococcota bacterium]
MAMRLVLAQKDVTARHALAAELEAAGHNVKEADDLEALMAHLKVSLPPEAVLVDVSLPGAHGAALVNRLLAAVPGLAVLVAYHPSEHSEAVACLKAGALEAFLNPVLADELHLRLPRARVFARVLGGAEAHTALQARVEELQRQLAETSLELTRAQAGRAAAESALLRLAVADPLTGLFNRRVFEERLHAEHQRARRFARPLSLVVLDVDHADRVEKAFGSMVLQQALKEMGRYLRDGTRETDFVARIDDDAFAVLLPETPHTGGRELANSLRRALGSASYPEAGRVTVSLGVASLETHASSESAEGLFLRAMEALRKAKEAGRDRVEG